MKFLTTTYPDLLKKRSAFFILFSLVSISLFGQGGTVSPYSRYGIGDLQFGGFTSEIGMGGINSGLHNNVQLNYSNPASYASLRYTTFETAVKSQFVQFESNTFKENSSSTSL